MNRQFGLMAGALLLLATAASASTIQISGGGTNVLWDTITAAQADPEVDTIEITDSAVYTESNINNPIGIHNLTIMASPGQNPQINFTANNNYDGAITPNADGLKFGSNAGGQITIRRMQAPSAFNGVFSPVWLPDGYQMTIENVKFTGVGDGGPWNGGFIFGGISNPEIQLGVTMNVNNCEFVDMADGEIQPLMNGPHWYSGLKLNVTNCKFTQTTQAQKLVGFDLGNDGTIDAKFSHCLFENYNDFAHLNKGNAEFDSCYFRNNKWLGILVLTPTGDIKQQSLTVRNCAFSGNAVGTYYILINSTEAPVVTIDHCDSVGTGEGSYFIQAYNQTNAKVSITNCNLGASPMLWEYDGVGAGFVGTYSHCNLFGTGIASIWTDGGGNINPGITPAYADLPDDWRYTNAELLTADSAGGPIGSQLHWLVDGVINAAKHGYLFD